MRTHVGEQQHLVEAEEQGQQRNQAIVYNDAPGHIMATSASVLAQLAAECAPEGLTVANSEKIAAELAKVFRVQRDEVGMLRLENDNLVFVHPVKLHKVGRIPLNSTTSLAVRTVHSKKAEIVNNFAHTRHTSFFEMVDVGTRTAGKKPSKEEQIIQKLMSVPVISANKVLGVIQVCRKGSTAPASGLDFTSVDLQRLVAIAGELAKCFVK